MSDSMQREREQMDEELRRNLERMAACEVQWRHQERINCHMDKQIEIVRHDVEAIKGRMIWVVGVAAGASAVISVLGGIIAKHLGL